MYGHDKKKSGLDHHWAQKGYQQSSRRTGGVLNCQSEPFFVIFNANQPINKDFFRYFRLIVLPFTLSRYTWLEQPFPSLSSTVSVSLKFTVRLPLVIAAGWLLPER